METERPSVAGMGRVEGRGRARARGAARQSFVQLRTYSQSHVCDGQEGRLADRRLTGIRTDRHPDWPDIQRHELSNYVLWRRCERRYGLSDVIPHWVGAVFLMVLGAVGASHVPGTRRPGY